MVAFSGELKTSFLKGTFYGASRRFLFLEKFSLTLCAPIYIRDNLLRTCGGLLTLSILGAAFIVTAIGNAWWVSRPVPGGMSRYGLWQTCTRANNGYEGCVTFDPSFLSAWFKGVQAFAVMAAGVSVIGAATQMYLPVGATLQLVSAIFGVISMGIFGARSGEPASNFHFAFYFMLTGSVLLFANGIALSVLAGREGCSMQKVMPPAKSRVSKSPV